MPTLKPTLSRVLVEIDPSEAKVGSLHIPAGAQRRLGYFTGVVIAVGPGKPLAGGAVRQPEVKPGDRVMYGIRHDLQSDQLKGYNRRVHDHYKDGLIETDARRLAIIEEDDIMAVIV